MCFSLGEETSRVAVLIHAWLSSMTITCELSPIPNLDNICRRYDASCDAAQSATYSASAVDNDWFFCMMMRKIIAALLRRNAYPVLDNLRSSGPPQLLSH
jgi:hypothetical protein